MQDCGKNQPDLELLSRILQDSWRSPVQKEQGAWNAGAGSGYGRDRQARWDAREMRTATTKIRRETYKEFRNLCEAGGKTPYAVLQMLLLDWMKQARVKDQETAEVWERRFTGRHSGSG